MCNCVFLQCITPAPHVKCYKSNFLFKEWELIHHAHLELAAGICTCPQGLSPLIPSSIFPQAGLSPSTDDMHRKHSFMLMALKTKLKNEYMYLLASLKWQPGNHILLHVVRWAALLKAASFLRRWFSRQRQICICFSFSSGNVACRYCGTWQLSRSSIAL